MWALLVSALVGSAHAGEPVPSKFEVLRTVRWTGELSDPFSEQHAEARWEYKLNSLPQLCINLTNESLHALFIEHVFKLEQETYVREEVEWHFVEYEDNQHVLDMITKRPVCLLGLLDEASGAAATDSSVLTNMHNTFGPDKERKYRSYHKPQKSADKCFCVSHYAGEVTYDITGFVEKNKDELSSDIEELLMVKTKFETLMGLAKRDAEKKADAEAAKATAKKSKGGAAKRERRAGQATRASSKSARTTQEPNQTVGSLPNHITAL